MGLHWKTFSLDLFKRRISASARPAIGDCKGFVRIVSRLEGLGDLGSLVSFRGGVYIIRGPI